MIKDSVIQTILKNIILILTILPIAGCYSVYGLQITEIMFNPDGADSGREWIELRLNENDGCVNLTSYKLFEEATNHNIYSIYPYERDVFCQIAILSNDPDKFLQDYPRLNMSLDSGGGAIIYKSSFSLSNSGEELTVKDVPNILDYINYSLLLDYITVEEGYTLELINNTWKRSLSANGSPGTTSTLTIENHNNTNNETNTNNKTYNNTYHNNTYNYTYNNHTYNITLNLSENVSEATNITINHTDDIPFDVLNNITINVSDIFFGNTTHNISDNISNDISDNILDNSSNQQDDPQQRCNVSLKIYLKNESLNIPYINYNGVQIKFYNRLEFHNNITKIPNYSIEYWVEDIRGNMLKSKMITNNQDEKSFTPKINEVDNILLIRGTIKNIDCSISKDSDEEVLLVKNDEYTPQQCTACSCKTTKCSPCTGKTSSSAESMLKEKSSISPMPSIKIVNVCNNSGSVSDDENMSGNMKEAVQLRATGIQTLSDNNSKKSTDKGLATGMVIYESPNLKNRFYAIVGLILVGLALIIIFMYKRKGVQT